MPFTLRRAAMATICAVGLTLPLGGCASLLTMIGQFAANLITQKTADLTVVAAQPTFTSNLYAPSAATFESVATGEAWKEGAGIVSINFLKRQGVGFYEIEGTVSCRKVSGGTEEPMPHRGNGYYSLFTPKGDLAPRLITVRSAAGQTASFTVRPAAPVKIKAINGKSAAAKIDLGRDLTLDLVNPGGTEGTMLRVSVMVSSLGIRNFADIGIFKSANRLVIPAAAFRNLSQSASQDVGAIAIVKGSSTLLVERFLPLPAGQAQVGAALALGKSWGSMPVDIVGDARPNLAISTEGTLTTPRGPVHYRVHKASAFSAPPLNRAHKVLVGSLVVRGTLFKQTSSTSTHYGVGTVTEIMTTTTFQFPKLSDVLWDGLLAETHSELGEAFGKVVGAKLLPTATLGRSPTYAGMDVVKGENTTRYIERQLAGTREVFPTSFGSMISGVSSTFAADRPIARVLRETGADALAAVTLDLQVATRKGGNEIVLLPSLRASLYGPPNGYLVGPTSFGDVVVNLGDGVPFVESQLASPGALARVVRLGDLGDALKKALADMRTKESQAGYDAIWKLQ